MLRAHGNGVVPQLSLAMAYIRAQHLVHASVPLFRALSEAEEWLWEHPSYKEIADHFHTLRHYEEKDFRIPTQFFRPESGQVLLFATLTMPVLIAVMVLCVDIGIATWRQAACLTSAQAGALAAASLIAQHPDGVETGFGHCHHESHHDAVEAGCALARANDTAPGGQTIVVRVVVGPYGIPVSGVSPDFYVVVLVKENVGPFFGIRQMVAASAVGAVWLSGPSQGAHLVG